MISSGRLAKLEGELALQKNLSDQMKQNQLEVSRVEIGTDLIVSRAFILGIKNTAMLHKYVL